MGKKETGDRIAKEPLAGMVSDQVNSIYGVNMSEPRKVESKPKLTEALVPTISNLNSIERGFEKAREKRRKDGYKKLTKEDLRDV